MKLKEQLRFYLKQKGLTAAQLARLSKVSKQSISDWLCGIEPRNINHIKRIADTLNTTVDNLLFGEGEEIQKKLLPLKQYMEEEIYAGKFEVILRRLKN